MATFPHCKTIKIVSLGGCKHNVPPVISSTASIVFIEFIQTSSAVWDLECLAKHMSSVPTEPNGSETALTSASSYPRTDAADASFAQHHKYFFKDENVTLPS